MKEDNFPWRKNPIYFVAIVDGKAMPNAFNPNAIKYCQVSDYPVVKTGLTFNEATKFCNEFNLKEDEHDKG